MGAIYKNYKAGDRKNTIPGYSVLGYIIPTDWIDTYAANDGNAAAGDRVSISANHILLAGKAAIEVHFVKESVSGDGDFVGETLAKRVQWKPKASIPGDTPELLDMMNGLVNKTFLLFYQDSQACADGSVSLIQFGSKCDPCEVAGGGFKSGTNGAGRKQWDVEFDAYSKYFFNGVIEVLDDATEIIEA
jgi:hypothetical protein